MFFLAFSCKQPSHYFTLQYTGNILGEFRPCGCSEKPLGGIDRFSGLLSQGSNDSNPIFLVAGNSFFSSLFIPEEFENQYKVKARLLFKSLAILKPIAVLVGKKDLVQGLEFLKEMNKEESLPLISSNLKSKKGEFLFKPYIIKEFTNFKLGIFGLTGGIEYIKNGNRESLQKSIYGSKEKREKTEIKRENALKSSRQTIRKLKQKGVHFIILLS